MKKALILFFLSFFIFPSSFSQQPQWDWAKSFGVNDSDKSNAICSDKFGNIYITGDFDNSIIFGGYTLNSSSSTNYFTAKFDSEGNTIWAKTLFGGWSVRGYDICCDTMCNIYASGIFTSIIVSETDTLLSNGNYDVFLIKYDTNGNEQWIKHISGDDDDKTLGGLDTDNKDGVYITGYFRSSQLFVDSDTLYLNGGEDIFLIKYDSNGYLIWALNEGGSYYDRGYDLNVNDNGNICITGMFESQNINFCNTVLTNSGGQDFFLAKYNKNGICLWAKQAYGSNHERGGEILFDNDNNIVVIGFFSSPILYFDGDSTFHNGSNYDLFLAKYDSLSNLLWVKSPADGHQNFMGLCIDDQNNIYLGGKYSSNFDFGTFVLNHDSITYAKDPFIAKYSSIGVAQWAIGATVPVKMNRMIFVLD
ncbi:MAG: hypothetical protein HN704_13430 [Bacteroidetes bacterium]|jgi:hypothetical protein|nr:hypothetical protein [Bacteroidota bacterium]MBT6685117.1 hypothetical protein [Bacteroidota bacterium]MBT7142696.1 hypothetical protein [Bacteroidota bacterium]MBT7492598.1 hypothetical protein [Bacteroidota bacterium]